VRRLLKGEAKVERHRSPLKRNVRWLSVEVVVITCYAMTFEELNSELQKLVGETVSFVRVATNSIIIYFFGEPGSDSVVSVFIDPTWRFQRHGKVVVGSYDLQMDESDAESEEECREEFQRMAALTHGLQGAALESVEIDFDSSDITMKFSDGQVVRNFANSAFVDEDWTYRNVALGIAADVSPSGITLRNEKE
jgi:hypothetical protein